MAADVELGVKAGYQSVTSAIPLEVLSGTDKVSVSFIDNYSKMGLKVTKANGTVEYWEAGLTKRS